MDILCRVQERFQLFRCPNQGACRVTEIFYLLHCPIQAEGRTRVGGHCKRICPFREINSVLLNMSGRTEVASDWTKTTIKYGGGDEIRVTKDNRARLALSIIMD